MSLTSGLEDPTSPVRRFFQDRFPNLRLIKREVREQVVGRPTIRQSEAVPYGTVGTAIDYRISCYFPAARPLLEDDWGTVADLGAGLVDEHLRAQSGARVLVATGFLSQELANQFFLSLRGTLRELSPIARKLAKTDEERLCRHCFTAALFDEIVRYGGISRSLQESLIGALELEALLAQASKASIDDLCQMSWAFYDGQQDLLSAEAVLNPTFDGSRDVGGADADLIVDRCLVEVKTALDPANIKKRSWPWQLLGYALLDYSDTYAVEAVGLYLARQATLVRWPLDEYASKLAGRDVSLNEARRDLKVFLLETTNAPGSA
jgi:hypothetical protein